MAERYKKHVIIGNSAAGLSAIKAIRKTGDTGSIVLISAESCNAYSPVLTTYYISGQIGKSNLFFVDDSFYKLFDVHRVFGHKAIGIDSLEREVLLDNRTRITYDNLLIATGGSAKPLDCVDQNALEFVSTLRTIKDADKIKKAGEMAREMVFLGAGLVSLQSIKALLGKGIEMTVVVGSNQVLSQQMDSDSAYILQEKLESAGVNILFGRGVEKVVRNKNRACVFTSYGERLPADMVVVGKGVSPNTELVNGTGIKVNKGILVDNRMQTSLENVFAAGDVAEGENEITGQMEVIATWFNACAQGEVAGLNMAGCSVIRRGQFRENVTTILGLEITSLGLSSPEEGKHNVFHYKDRKNDIYRKFLIEDSHVVGALLLGKGNDAGVIRHCIANRIDITPWREEIAKTPLDFGKIMYGHGIN
ncbi:MAG: NAD(P)/FAD-dependent oxidoreductase [Desulfobacterales bacterium]|nr:NAD(P)/FAD-dependent oxidoreductase [Desulfobacterales bacterium]